MTEKSNEGGESSRNRSSHHATTKPKAAMPPTRLVEVETKSYLCAKCCIALAEPFCDSKGRSLYQRTATEAIWYDERHHSGKWGYKAEVGFDMTKRPPVPIMSQTEKGRPSRWPLHAYSKIMKGHDAAIRAYDGAKETAGEISRWVIGKEVLEKVAQNVDPRSSLVSVGGSALRIPDVIVLKARDSLDQALPCREEDFIPEQSNINRVVEIKFEGDSFGPGQITAYRAIAGKNPFDLLKPEGECACRKKSKTCRYRDPVRVPVPEGSGQPARARQGRPNPVATPVPNPFPPGPIRRPVPGGHIDLTPTGQYVDGKQIVKVVLVIGLVIVVILCLEEIIIAGVIEGAVEAVGAVLKLALEAFEGSGGAAVPVLTG